MVLPEIRKSLCLLTQVCWSVASRCCCQCPLRFLKKNRIKKLKKRHDLELYWFFLKFFTIYIVIAEVPDVPTTEIADSIPVSSCEDWQAAFGFSSKSRDSQDDDLGLWYDFTHILESFRRLFILFFSLCYFIHMSVDLLWRIWSMGRIFQRSSRFVREGEFFTIITAPKNKFFSAKPTKSTPR